jgi:hypothetical protein
MKVKSTLSFLLIFVSTVTFCQDFKKEIETSFMGYVNALMKKDFDKAIGYISADLFEVIPKDQVKQSLKEAFDNPKMEFQIKKTIINEINNPKKADDQYYALFTYSNTLNIKPLELHDSQKTEEELALKANVIKLSLDQDYGAEHVEYNPQSKTFEVYSEQQVYAISLNGKTNWKFIVIDPRKMPIFEKALPKKVTDKIK